MNDLRQICGKIKKESPRTLAVPGLSSENYYLLLGYGRFQAPPILDPIIDSLPFAIGWYFFVYGYPAFRWFRFESFIFTYSLGWITWCITGLAVLLFVIAGLLAANGVEAPVFMDIFIAVCILWALVDLITYLLRIEYD